MLTVTAMFCHIQALSLIPHMLVTDMPDLMVLNKVTFLSCANVRKIFVSVSSGVAPWRGCYTSLHAVLISKPKNENFVNDKHIFTEIALEEVDAFPFL